MSNVTIKDLPCNEEIDMSAVHGGAPELGIGTGCIDVNATLSAAARDKGAYGVISAAADLLGGDTPLC
jgi:hypothetical protein